MGLAFVVLLVLVLASSQALAQEANVYRQFLGTRRTANLGWCLATTPCH